MKDDFKDYNFDEWFLGLEWLVVDQVGVEPVGSLFVGPCEIEWEERQVFDAKFLSMLSLFVYPSKFLPFDRFLELIYSIKILFSTRVYCKEGQD